MLKVCKVHNVIYLIGGPPKCGKTTLAKRLSKEIGVSWISGDTVQNIVKLSVPEDEFSQKFPSSNHRTKSNDERFEKYTAQELTEQYCSQAQASQAALEALIETYLVDEDDFIIEGYQVTPIFVEKMIDRFTDEQIRSIFLIRSNAEQFVEDISHSSTPNDWIIKRTQHPNIVYPQIAEMVILYSEKIQQEAEKCSLKTMNVDQDFERKLEDAISILKM